MVVFAIQNVIRDPPFTRMDLISCRNLLIYLETETPDPGYSGLPLRAQPRGTLFLSPSEGIGNFTDLFAPVDKKWKIYRAKSTGLSARALVAQRFAWTGETPGAEPGAVPAMTDKTNFAELPGACFSSPLPRHRS